jgi:hypothetical protein
MTAISWNGIQPVYRPWFARLCAGVLVLLALLGILSLVAARSERADRPQCGGFTIGVSAIGGCDTLGGSPKSQPWWKQTLIR